MPDKLQNPQLNPQTLEKAYKILNEIFKIPNFRTGQKEIIESILNKNNTLAVMPTGGGKSLCYQLPALIYPGLTLVISPLIALMKDQVDALIEKNIPAAYLNSAVPYPQQCQIIEELKNNQLKLLFVAPEKLRNANFQKLLTELNINLLAVDEAHCISQWGHDFRPDYRQIGEIRSILNNPPTIALTATASPDVQQDIIHQLNLKTPDTHILGFDRPNLLFRVKHFKTFNQKLQYLLTFIRKTLPLSNKNPINGCGLIYASTRKEANKAYLFLRENGIHTGIYHAKLSDEERTRVQEAFMNDDYHCLIATNAFGMGVDKPNIRYVIHLALSSSLEAYTQEAGRAGRDRNNSQCILLYAPRDVKIQEFFIQAAFPAKKLYNTITEALKELEKQNINECSLTNLNTKLPLDETHALEIALRKLQTLKCIEITPDQNIKIIKIPTKSEINELARQTKSQEDIARKRLKKHIEYVNNLECRTKFILDYFGAKTHKNFKCYHCDLCKAFMPLEIHTTKEPFPPENPLFIIQKTLSAILRLHQTLSTYQIIQHLTANKPFETNVSTWALLDYLPNSEINILISVLSENNLLLSSNEKLRLTPLGIQALKAKSINELPKHLALYLNKRFPNHPNHNKPYKPSKTNP